MSNTVIILMITIIIFALWFTGVIERWLSEIAYIANNTEEFTDTKGHRISSEYSISINLNDLKSNIRKELYIE